MVFIFLVWPLQKCDRREIHSSCPTTCPEVCKYGRHKNVNCSIVQVCVPRCVCRSQYTLDPITNECWTRSYCLYRRKMSFFKGIFGIKE